MWRFQIDVVDCCSSEHDIVVVVVVVVAVVVPVELVARWKSTRMQFVGPIQRQSMTRTTTVNLED